MEEIKDERFSHITSDPRFRTTPKSIRKVKIDKRFQSLFTDKRFQIKYAVDKRGRPISQSSQENYRKYYDVSSEESSVDEDEEREKEEDRNASSVKEPSSGNVFDRDEDIKKVKSPKSNKWVITPSSALKTKKESPVEVDNAEGIINKERNSLVKKKEESKQLESEQETDLIEKARLTDEIKMKLRDPHIDYARGIGALMSDSSSEEESSESESESELEHEWGELDRDADVTEEATARLAVLHMDWDRIRAVDLMVLFNSFLPQDGVIKSVTIYPSEFGLQRMKEEEERGPIELVNVKPEKKSVEDEESKEGKKYHTERLRQYQLNRLKYYYAIVEFDSVETANKVYTECDGLEYESSATKIDLRFVPEGETFEQEPHEVCTSMPDPTKYEPRIFTNTALQQGKVELTWDETDPSRQEFTKKIQKNADKIDDVDLQAYLASSSGEDEDDSQVKGSVSESESESDQENTKEEDKIAKYKSLLASIEEEEEKKKNRDVDLEITWGIGLKEKAEKSVKEKLNAPQTPFEEMLDKRRKKKKLKREEKLKQKEKKENDEDSDLYSDDDLPSDIDMNDPYFKEELQGSKKEKKKKKILDDEEETEEIKQKKAELELLLLEENDIEKEKNHFNMKKIQEQENEGKKKKRRKQLKKKPQESSEDKDEFKVDVADDRFSALFTSHHFNVDPADPQFRKTKAMEAIISEKLKRRREQVDDQTTGKKVKTNTELTQLVNKIKSKTKHKLKK